MELDKRIKALTDIQSVTDGCHDWEFMTKKGYFADRIANFQDLSKCEYGTYVDYREHDKCFHCEVNLPDGTSDYNWFSYFIPEDSLLPVEKPEKKFRPFTPEEFVAEFPAGSKIIYRHIGEDREINIVVITRIETTEDFEFINVYFGTDLPWELKYMFETLEIKIDSKWQPFGVIDEEDE